MNKETYGALKRLMQEVKEYRKIVNKDFPIIMGNDIQLVESWIDEVEKEYKED